MLFPSLAFLAFFPTVLLVDLALQRRPGPRKVFLLLASYFFYACWDWRFLGLIWASTLVDWFVGNALARTEGDRKRRWLLVISLGVNLGLLATFKYLNFFIESAAAFLALFGLGPESVRTLDIILPVGISFYTFQTLSYSIDIFRGKLKPAESFVDFALFVAFFPQLVAGPIVRARDFLPQLKRNPGTTREGISDGLYDIISGLFKKVVIADTLGAGLVDPLYADPASFGAAGTLAGIYGYAFQLYGDFAGYSQIAIGVARILGFRLPENFRAPYIARNLADMWARWHITLSTWVRDYMFMPLGGYRRGVWFGAFNLFLTFVLMGLWHGAGWNFIAFGAYNGLVLAISTLRRKYFPQTIRKDSTNPLVALWQWGVTFNLFWIPSTIIFRAGTFDKAGEVVSGLTRLGGDPPQLTLVALVGLAALLHWRSESWNPPLRRAFVRLSPEVQGVLFGVFLGLVSSAQTGATPFIYFQF